MNNPTAIVMVVDDDAGVRNAMRSLLKSVGITSQLHASAQDFLSGYDARQPGCLVLDIRMPGMSGLIAAESFAAPPFPDLHDLPCDIPCRGGEPHGAFDVPKAISDQDLLDESAARYAMENRTSLRRTPARRAPLKSDGAERGMLDLCARQSSTVSLQVWVQSSTIDISRPRHGENGRPVGGRTGPHDARTETRRRSLIRRIPDPVSTAADRGVPRQLLTFTHRVKGGILMNTQSHRAATPRCLMEHRWGARVALDVSVQLQVEGGRIFAGRIRDASISGAFVVCTAGFSPLTSLEVSLEFGGTRLTLPACVLRHAEDGIGSNGATGQ